jgi:hypothetical protein
MGITGHSIVMLLNCISLRARRVKSMGIRSGHECLGRNLGCDFGFDISSSSIEFVGVHRGSVQEIVRLRGYKR